MKFTKQKWNYYLLLLLVLCVGMWQLSFFKSIMKWDIMDISLPWRYFLSECLSNGILPLWNPFMTMGFPQMAHPETWYPVSWLISLFGYDIIAVQYEHLFHLFIGGAGYYTLARHFNISSHASFLTACAYMFCGFFTAHAQHLAFTVSGAWFPWVIVYYLRFTEKRNASTFIPLLLLLFFMLTGGYPGVFISLAYIMILLFLYKLFKMEKFSKRMNWAASNFLVIMVFVLLSAVVLICSFQVKEFITRGGGMPYEGGHWSIIAGYLPLKALVSFLFPAAVAVDSGYWGEDICVLNCYIGTIAILFLLYGQFSSTSVQLKRLSRVFAIVGIVFLMIALVKVFPFRKWLYLYAPFMDVFRVPALFRFFSTFFFLLAAGIGLDCFFRQEKPNKKFYIIGGGVSILILLFVLYHVPEINNVDFSSLWNTGWISFSENAGIPERIVFQGAGLLLILLPVLILVFFFPTHKKSIITIAFLIDIIGTFQLLSHDYVISKDRSVSEIQGSFNKLPTGYPFPDIQQPMNAEEGKMKIPYLWKNVDIFRKIPSQEGFNPYKMITAKKAKEAGVYRSSFSYPLLFLAQRLNGNIIDSLSLVEDAYRHIQITDFNPNLLEMKVDAKEKQFLVLMQTTYPGWKAYVNGEQVEIIAANYNFMAIPVGKGEQHVRFEFTPRSAMAGFYVSSAVFALLLLLIPIYLLVNRKK